VYVNAGGEKMKGRATKAAGFKRIMVTGITEAGSSDILEEFASAKRATQINIQHHEIGRIITKHIIPENRMKLTDQNILNTIPDLLTALHLAALYRELPKIKNSTGINLFDMHATFLTTIGLMGGLCCEDMKLIDPDLFITIIDGPKDIHSRLKKHPGEYFDLTIADIVKWQEIEVYVTNIFASFKQVPHFVVPFREGESILEKILFQYEPPEKRSANSTVPAYVSYPITYLPQEERQKRDQFRDKLKERSEFIIFDPGSVELSLDIEPCYTAEDVRAIEAHTVVRDLSWFIRINSEKVIAYMALTYSDSEDKPPAITASSGSNDELRYAYEAGLETYIVLERKAGQRLPLISPFTKYKAKVFATCNEFFDYLTLPHDQQAIYDIASREMASWIRMQQTPADIPLNEQGVVPKDAEQETVKETFKKQCRRLCQYHLRTEPKTEVLNKIVDTLLTEWSQPQPLGLQIPLPIRENHA
jgi:adenylate kinase